MGAELSLNESGVKSAVRRIRQRYREVFRAEEISRVADPSEFDDELQFLLRAMGKQELEVG